MSDERDRPRRLADELIDYAVYAPLGAAMTVAEQFPELVRRGRERFSGQVKLAQVIGRVAVDSARRQAEGFVRGSTRRSEPAPAQKEDPSAAGDDVHPAHRAIPGYEALAAAEVIAKLSSLGKDELRAVRDYEQSHRARRTVLGRIAQLLEGGPR
ncbi:MAG TPA: hypothetical protein VKR27_04095 [Acidimicrobiales bacterium]|nr:hypothetical protein [Acidimicrobiales bacterium]